MRRRLTEHPFDCVLQLVIGIAIAGLSVAYAGWNLSNSKNLFGISEEVQSATARVLPTADCPLGVLQEEEEYVSVEMQERGTDEEDPQAVGTLGASEKNGFESEDDGAQEKLDEWRGKQRRFHFVMACCSM